MTPVVVLAGADPRPGALPPAGSALHPLAGHKAATLRIGGRPLIQSLVERLAPIGPVHVAGPLLLYGRIVPRLIDTDGTLVENVRAALAAVTGPLFFAASDWLPEPGELRDVMARFDPSAAVWYPLVRAPSDLRASAWKPKYRIVPAPGAPPIWVLPGHLMFVDPAALRLPLVLRLMQAAYETRNHPILMRRRAITAAALASLLAEDTRRLLAARFPDIMMTVIGTGWRVARGLKRGTLLLGDLERALESVVLERRDRHVRLPIVEARSFAVDFDTREEAAAAS